MALPLNGQLSMNDIRVELGIPTQSPFSLDTATNGGYVTLNPCSPYLPSSTNPDTISEWYGYCHNCSCSGVATGSIYSNVAEAGGGDVTWTSPESYTLTPGSTRGYYTSSVGSITVGFAAVLGRITLEPITMSANTTSVTFTGKIYKHSTWTSVTWNWYDASNNWTSSVITDNTQIQLTNIKSIPGIRRFVSGGSTLSTTSTNWLSPGATLPNATHYNFDSVSSP